MFTSNILFLFYLLAQREDIEEDDEMVESGEEETAPEQPIEGNSHYH